MPRGGYREGAGRGSSWKHGKTKPVRVPVALAEEILAIARLLDCGQRVSPDKCSKCIDLSGVAIVTSRQGPMVRLSDLIRIGYTIKPERLTKNLKALPPLDPELSSLLQAFDNYDQ